jgi:enoyl-CoA hydratase
MALFTGAVCHVRLKGERYVSYNTILYEKVEDGIVQITLNRPEKLNAMNLQLLHEIIDAITRAEQDDEVVVMVIRGAGTSFSAGRDFKFSGQMAQEDDRGWDAWRQEFPAPHNRLWRSHKISIAAVQGYALGGGHTLALGCDLVVCAEGAKFGYTDTRFGMILLTFPDFWVEWLGQRKAKEILLTGYFLDADDAYHHNLVNKVVPPEELDGVVLSLARDVVLQERRHPGQAAAIKFQINRQNLVSLAGLDRYMYEGCQKLREYERQMPDIQAQYFDRAARDGAPAMIKAMRSGYQRDEL